MTTLGTNANNSLNGFVFVRGGAAGFTAANIAAIKAGILDDINASHPVAQVIGSGGFFDNGVLYIPNRGPGIQLLPGDAVAWDTATGWPIVVSARALAAGPWTFV